MSDNNKDVLRKIVGSDNLLDNSDLLAMYSKDESFVVSRKPKLVVKVKTEDQVQEIVRWANETLTPLVPVSSGPPHFHGDTIPSVGGAVIVDLSDMKQVTNVDRRNRVAIIEPGVTYEQLQPELARQGLRLPMPLLPRRSKSVMTALLEREPHMSPKYHWSLSDPLRTIHVVWGNGETLVSGAMGRLGPSVADSVPVYPLGPLQIDYNRIVQAAQGSMGIVTRASIGCEVSQQVQKLFFVPSPSLEHLLSFAYRVVRIRYGDEFLFLNNVDLANIIGENNDQIEDLRGKLPPWVLLLNIAGYEYFPDDCVEVQEREIMDIAQEFGTQVVSSIHGIRNGQILEILNRPSNEPYWKLRNKGGCQDIFFLTTLDKTPELVNTMYSIAQQYGYSNSEIGSYIQPVHQGVCCHCEFSLPYEPGNSQESAKVKEILFEASRVLMNKGAFFSRPYGIWADLAFNRDAQSTIVLKKIKSIFDPNNVMNPGKLCF
jgi:FAD/FMN-containing dehydrogenase